MFFLSVFIAMACTCLTVKCFKILENFRINRCLHMIYYHQALRYHILVGEEGDQLLIHTKCLLFIDMACTCLTHKCFENLLEIFLWIYDYKYG